MNIKDRLFSDKINFEQKVEIRNKYKDWDEPYFFFSKRAFISPTAIKISKRIEEEFSINLFPCIWVTKTKGYSESANFAMVDKHNKEYLFFDKSISFASNNISIYIDVNEFYLK